MTHPHEHTDPPRPAHGDHLGDQPAGPPTNGLGHIQDWEGLALEYLDGSITPQDRAAVDAHLRGCETCRGAMAGQSLALDFLATAPMIEPPAALQDRVLAATAPATRRPVPWWDRLRGRTGVPAWMPAAAVVLLLVVVGATAVRLVSGEGGRDLALRSAEAPTTTAAAALQAAPEASAPAADGREGYAGSSSDQAASAPPGSPTTTAPSQPMTATGGEDSVETTTTAAGSVASPPIVTLHVETPGSASGPWTDVFERLTGLSPLPDLALGDQAVFAAYLDAGSVDRFAQALQAHGLAVTTTTARDDGTGTTLAPLDPDRVRGALAQAPRRLVVTPDGSITVESFPTGDAVAGPDQVLMVVDGPAVP